MEKEWITTYDDVISSEFCDKCISLFNDPSSAKGEHKEYWRRCKEYTSLDASPLWNELKSIIKQSYDRYRKEHASGVLNYANFLEAPNMFRYDPNPETPNIFNDHADCWNFPTATRQISIILYLNDVEEGGGTTFPKLEVSIKPKRGRILLFPSSFTYIHRGDAPISNPKYIIVSWFHFDGQGHAYRVHKL